jgi:hypothetical protein
MCLATYSTTHFRGLWRMLTPVVNLRLPKAVWPHIKEWLQNSQIKDLLDIDILHFFSVHMLLCQSRSKVFPFMSKIWVPTQHVLAVIAIT